MSTRPFLLALFVAAAGLTAACKVSTDLGDPCVMVKKNPNPDSGAASVPITESEITPGKDFISFGAVECEDLVCVLDAQHAQLTGDPNAAVTGYCSRSCVPGASSACTPQATASNDKSADLKMACRALFLDPDTLGRICQNDPAKCQQYFGNNSSPYFCARGGDAGTP